MTILKKVNGKKLSFNHQVKVSRKMAKMLSVSRRSYHPIETLLVFKKIPNLRWCRDQVG